MATMHPGYDPRDRDGAQPTVGVKMETRRVRQCNEALHAHSLEDLLRKMAEFSEERHFGEVSERDATLRLQRLPRKLECGNEYEAVLKAIRLRLIEGTERTSPEDGDPT